MGSIFKILGVVGLVLFVVGFPNARPLREATPEILGVGVSFVLFGIGLLGSRMDRLEEVLKGAGQKPS